MSARDPYQVLGVAASASAAEIKAAYRALVKQHHPDAGGDEHRILELNAAWEVLGDSERHARSLREGSALTLQRLDDLLASHRVRPIAALGQALDPQCMQAVGIEWAPQAAEGVVLRELRRGYQQGTVLLRSAEVIVNKKGPTP